MSRVGRTQRRAFGRRFVRPPFPERKHMTRAQQLLLLMDFNRRIINLLRTAANSPQLLPHGSNEHSLYTDALKRFTEDQDRVGQVLRKIDSQA